MPFERISVVGLGYIGLPAAVILASRGVEVIGVDSDPQVVAMINDGEGHIKEPMLDVAVQSVVTTGRLKAVTHPKPAQAFLITVPTPLTTDRTADLSYIKAAAESLAPVLKAGNLVIVESTSPVGTTEQMSRWLAEACPDLTFPQQAGENADILVAYCPERVMPGNVMHELIENDRIIGGMSLKSSERAIELYKIFLEGECLVTDVRTAEMVKLAENAFRDLNLAFANELSIICDHMGINVWELIRLANHHPRVDILKPGPGVGGHCIAVDPWFIVNSVPELAHLIRTAREVNDDKPRYVVRKVKEAATQFDQPVITCLGLSFKADVDDLRESPAVEIVRELAKEGGKILVVEPHIDKLPLELANQAGIELVELDEGLKKADILVVLVDHKVFKSIPLKAHTASTVIDTRGACGGELGDDI